MDTPRENQLSLVEGVLLRETSRFFCSLFMAGSERPSPDGDSSIPGGRELAAHGPWERPRSSSAGKAWELGNTYKMGGIRAVPGNSGAVRSPDLDIQSNDRGKISGPALKLRSSSGSLPLGVLQHQAASPARRRKPCPSPRGTMRAWTVAEPLPSPSQLKSNRNDKSRKQPAVRRPSQSPRHPTTRGLTTLQYTLW